MNGTTLRSDIVPLIIRSRRPREATRSRSIVSAGEDSWPGWSPHEESATIARPTGRCPAGSRVIRWTTPSPSRTQMVRRCPRREARRRWRCRPRKMSNATTSPGATTDDPIMPPSRMPDRPYRSDSGSWTPVSYPSSLPPSAARPSMARSAPVLAMSRRLFVHDPAAATTRPFSANRGPPPLRHDDPTEATCLRERINA